MKTPSLVAVALTWIMACGVSPWTELRGEVTQTGTAKAAPANQNRDSAAKPTVSAGIADVLKMAERGVDASVIKAFVENYPVAYHASADEIITLHEAGISSEIIAALLRRSTELRTQQWEANQRALAQRAQAQRAAAATEMPSRPPAVTVAPQAPAPAPQVNYVYPTYPTYPAYSYSYSYALPLSYSSAYCFPPYRYSHYGYWPRSYYFPRSYYYPRTACWPSWPSWPSYGVGLGFRSHFGFGNVGFKSAYCARPGFRFHSSPRFACR
jgi:hypothetical protein